MASVDNKPRPKQKLWFDPKFPPVTPVYVGQKKPIYLVPEDTHDDDRLPQDDWERTEWYFEIVCIRQIVDEEGDKKTVVDVKWPNGYVDHDVPISSMYGTFVKLKRSQLAHYTEEYNSDDEYIEIDLRENQTDEEKLQQLLKLLKYMSENHDYLIEQYNKEEAIRLAEVTTAAPTNIVTNETSTKEESEKTDGDGINVIEPEGLAVQVPISSEEQAPNVTLQMINDWFLTPSKGGLSLPDLRKKAAELGIEDPQQYKKTELRQRMTALAVDLPKEQDNETEPVTNETIEEWFSLPSKGGLSLAELRKKAAKMGIQNPQQYKRADLKDKMIAVL